MELVNSNYIEEEEDESVAPVQKKWVPEMSYSKKLADIANQMTPAEMYRHKLGNTT